MGGNGVLRTHLNRMGRPGPAECQEQGIKLSQPERHTKPTSRVKVLIFNSLKYII